MNSRLRFEVDVDADASDLEKLKREANDLQQEFKQVSAEMRDMETRADRLEQEIKESGKAFEKAKTETIRLKVAYKELAKSGEATEQELRDLSQRITEAEKAELASIHATRKLVKEYDQLGDELGHTDKRFDDLSQSMNHAEGYINGIDQKVRSMGKGFDKVGNKIDDVGDELQAVGRKMDRAGDDIEKMARSNDRAADSLDKLHRNGVKMEAMGSIIADGVEEAAQAIWDFVLDSRQAFLDFDRSTREIFTLIPEASGQFREALTTDITALGTELGRLPQEMTDSVYQALSAGVPKENVLTAVETASKAARAGVADLSSTLGLGLGIMNAQVDGVSNLEQVYDLLFFTVKNGVITLPEMNEVMSQVTSIAGEAGVSMQDISAAMVVMTKQGDSAAEAAELLSIMLTQLSTSGTTLASVFEQAAGQSFRSFVSNGGTLAEAMELLQKHADDTGQALGDILGGGSPFFRDTQAARGALELTGKHLDELIEYGKEAEEAFGSLGEAAAEMGQSAELDSQRAAAAFEEMKIAIGEGIAPLTEKMARGATEFFKVFSGNRGRQVSGLTDDLIDAAQATGDWETALGKMVATKEQFGTIGGAFLVPTYIKQGLDDSIRTAVEGMAASSTSADEFRAKLENVGFEVNRWGDASAGNYSFNIDWEFERVGAEQLEAQLRDSDVALTQYAATYDFAKVQQDTWLINNEIQIESLERIDEKLLASAQNVQFESSQWANAVEQKKANIAADEQIAAVAEDRAARIQAALEAEKKATVEANKAFNSYGITALDNADKTYNWTDELFRNAAAQGVSVEQLAILAAATGEYSDEQIEAMLKTAAMKVAVDELSAALANGEITTQEAIASLKDFEASLDEPFEAELDYKDFIEGEAQANATRAALLAAEGDYKASFTTTNTTVNETVERGGGATPPTTAMYRGGGFQAFEPLIVGDGPNGEILPTTELIIPQQPGYVIPGPETNRIFNPRNNEEIMTPSADVGGSPVMIQIHQEISGQPDATTLAQLKEYTQAAVQEALRNAGYEAEARIRTS